MSRIADAWAVADPTVCPECGIDSCEAHLPPAVVAERTQRPHLTFQRAADVINAPAPIAIAEGIAWGCAVTVIVGESGSGKSFFVTELSACISAGLPFLNRQTRQGSVAYFLFEGDALGQRLKALRDVRGHWLEHVYFVRPRDPLSPRVTRESEKRSIGELEALGALSTLRDQLAGAGLPPIVLVVADTVRASLSGSEDNTFSNALDRAVERLPLLERELERRTRGR